MLCVVCCGLWVVGCALWVVRCALCVRCVWSVVCGVWSVVCGVVCCVSTYLRRRWPKKKESEGGTQTSSRLPTNSNAKRALNLETWKCRSFQDTLILSQSCPYPTCPLGWIPTTSWQPSSQCQDPHQTQGHAKSPPGLAVCCPQTLVSS